MQIGRQKRLLEARTSRKQLKPSATSLAWLYCLSLLVGRLIARHRVDIGCEQSLEIHAVECVIGITEIAAD